ncbi:OmpA family protein [Rhodobacteraceae bacterium KMM 6894]|nr:OmpA family protein [Rhodobacteraceae bacterium KMM 6894]
MTENFLTSARRALSGIAAAALGAVLIFAGGAAIAQQTTAPVQEGRVVSGERYVPTIWVDPDGCEHWVMDDGWEGYMSPHVTRQGIPVCRRGNVCGVVNTDQLFKTDSAKIYPHAQAKLKEFFSTTGAISYIIVGHTDSRASDEYNMDLSLRRANSVARVASKTGVRIADVRGYGERMPRATNNTAAGMQQNRRVEIICIR